VQQHDIPPLSLVSDLPKEIKEMQEGETHPEYQRKVLKYITEIGSSLRLDMDTDTLFKRVSEATCKALGFRYSVLYLSDGLGNFRACATAGSNAEEEEFLRQHPVPETVVAQLISEEYRMSESYFIAAEAPVWKNSDVMSFFVLPADISPSPAIYQESHISLDRCWKAEDMLLVPLVSGDNTLLGFLTPDAPLNGLRPTDETLSILEMFANQAAVVIEGARLFEEAQRNIKERAALIEIGRVLSAPDALRDLETVYQIIYEQVKRVMPADAFFVTRYYHSTGILMMDYLIDEEVKYPPFEYEYFPFNMKALLFEEKLGYIFSTREEYALFVNEQVPPVEEDLFGSMRPSESFLYAPIHYGEESVGFLSAQSYRPQAYTKRDLVMLKEISVQAGIAITNARLNSELRDALKQAQQSDQLKNHFLMTASHELRTPLTAIQGYLELLGTFGTVLDEEAKQRFLTNARRACEELVLLLGNVMDTSIVDQDRVSLNLGPVQVVGTLQLILEILEPTIAREERPVVIKIPDDLYVWVDDLRLRQILLNLVGNALKYTPALTQIEITAEGVDSDTLRERVFTSHGPISEMVSDRFVIVAIRDWGPGIRVEDQARLFTKFMRLDSALNSVQRGAGLGLYLCRQLTEAMGGYIWIESQGIVGEGSTFVIALPRYEMEGQRSG
jgi:signal transduction histidine kinase